MRENLSEWSWSPLLSAAPLIRSVVFNKDPSQAEPENEESAQGGSGYDYCAGFCASPFSLSSWSFEIM